MNFDFVRECKMEDPALQTLYDEAAGLLTRAEENYWRNPQECGICLRRVAELVCGIYDGYYEVGCGQGMPLTEYLCYTADDDHNVMVSRFLSVSGKEQRDRLNRLRVLGDDCLAGRNAPDQGMTFEDRMGQNARRMMECALELMRDMCIKINKREDIAGIAFSEDELPEKRPSEPEEPKKGQGSRIGRLFSRKG